MGKTQNGRPLRRQIAGLLALLIAVGLLGTLQSCGNATKTEKVKTPGIVISDSTAGDSATLDQKIARLTEQLQYAPTNWELWYERSVLQYENGNTGGAQSDIEKAIKHNITHPDPYHMRGFYYYVQNRDSAAMRDFKRSVEQGSENPETFYHIGQLHFFKKEYKLADDAYDAAIKIDSMQPTYYFAKGFMQQDRNNIDGAVGYYSEALGRNPTFIKALMSLHDIYLNIKKDPDQAYAFNDRILLIDSLHPVGRFNQGNFFMARANKLTEDTDLPEFQVLLKVAIAEFGKCLQSDPNFVRAYYNRGYAFYLMGRYPQALSDFSMVIQLDPFDENAFFMKGSILEFQGDLRNALVNYQQAFKINPKFRDAELAVKELTAKAEAEKAGGAEEVGG